MKSLLKEYWFDTLISLIIATMLFLEIRDVLSPESSESKPAIMVFMTVTLTLGFLSMQIAIFNILRRRHSNGRGVHPFMLPISVLINLAIIVVYAKTYKSIGILHNGELVNSGRESLYFSVVTWTTLGYGDFAPSESIRMLAASQAFIGYVSMAMLIGLFLDFFLRQTR